MEKGKEEGIPLVKDSGIRQQVRSAQNIWQQGVLVSMDCSQNVLIR